MKSATKLQKKFIEYHCDWLNRKTSHYILIAKSSTRSTLLSHVNLFLFNHTRDSNKTSSRYADVVSAFYNFLSGQAKFSTISPWDYHRYTDNQDIVLWQSERETIRVRNNAQRPSSETIYSDALLLMGFFKWLVAHGYPTRVEITLKTWIAKYSNSRYQEYISLKARNVLDGSSIRVLDKENRQARIRSLITVREIEALATSYSDPVYSAMLLFAIGTAMRPMDLCKYPYIGNGENLHIMPFSSMRTNSNLKTKEDNGEPEGLGVDKATGSSVVSYTVSKGKGRKHRTIIIHLNDLKTLDETYIKPYYYERTKRYEERYRRKCPPSILFLNVRGEPVTPDMISSRTNAAKVIAKSKDPELRKNLVFYDARDWWPTYYLIRSLKAKLFNPDSEVYNLAMEQVMISQMGHGKIKVTFQHYLNMARVVMELYSDHKQEVFNVSEDGARAVIKTMSNSTR